MPPADATETADRSDTATRILDAAQDLVQQRGYNAVSYGDLAEALDLTTAAIHYHFPTKADLGAALVARYRQQNAAIRTTIRDEEDTLRAQLDRYIEGYAGILKSGGLCLCGVLAADNETLPAPVRREVEQFFAEQEDWLTEVIAAGTDGAPALPGYDSPRQVAELVLAAVEGAMITARRNGPDAYRATLRHLIRTVAT